MENLVQAINNNRVCKKNLSPACIVVGLTSNFYRNSHECNSCKNIRMKAYNDKERIRLSQNKRMKTLKTKCIQMLGIDEDIFDEFVQTRDIKVLDRAIPPKIVD